MQSGVCGARARRGSPGAAAETRLKEVGLKKDGSSSKVEMERKSALVEEEWKGETFACGRELGGGLEVRGRGK